MPMDPIPQQTLVRSVPLIFPHQNCFPPFFPMALNSLRMVLYCFLQTKTNCFLLMHPSRFGCPKYRMYRKKIHFLPLHFQTTIHCCFHPLRDCCCPLSLTLHFVPRIPTSCFRPARHKPAPSGIVQSMLLQSMQKIFSLYDLLTQSILRYGLYERA